MKKKIIVSSFCLALLLAQNAFVFSQVTGLNPRSNDELINLFDDPDMIAVIQVGKIIKETAPSLLAGHPETLNKFKTTIKTLENETGFNPYSVEKVVFGMHLSGLEDSTMVILQTYDPATEMLDKLFQSRTADAKFAPEINPLKNRIDLLERQSRTLTNGIFPTNEPSEGEFAVYEKFQTDLDAIKPLSTERAAFNKLKTDAAKMLELFKKYQSLRTSVYNVKDLEKRLADIKTQVNSISPDDRQRAAKIAAAGKTLLAFEKEFNEKQARMQAADQAILFSAVAPGSFPEIPEQMPTAPANRKVVLDELQTALTERIGSLNSLIEKITAKEIPASESLKQLSEEFALNPAFPLSQTVSRTDETVGGKKIVKITTVKKFPETSLEIEKTTEDEFLVFDDKTIIFGERPTLVKTLESKPENKNRVAKNLLARSPGALVSFGVNFRNMDISQFAEVFGESKTAWQIIGSLDSTGNDFSVTAAFEKSDIPVNVQPKKSDSPSIISPPPVPVDDETKDLVESMFKSMIGLEAKITIRFDKQKTAAFIEKSPDFLSKILKR